MRRVTTVDRFRTLVKSAERRWQSLGIRNISAMVADGTLGWPRQAPFDRIVVTAACAAAPGKLIAQLTDNGILIAPVGPRRASSASRCSSASATTSTRAISGRAIFADSSGRGAETLTLCQPCSNFLMMQRIPGF